MPQIKYKSYTSEHNSFNEAERSVVSFITTINPDRYNEIVLPEGVNTANYEKNPVVLLNHNSPLPVGKNLWIKKEANGIKAKTQWADTSLGNDLMKLYKDGFMRAFSIGFIPKEVIADEEKRIVHKDAELLEYSAVTIPANQDALVLSFKSVETPMLKEIFEREISQIELYNNINALKEDFDRKFAEYELKAHNEDLIKKYAELEDKFNMLSEVVNQILSNEKREEYKKQFEKRLFKETLDIINNQI